MDVVVAGQGRVSSENEGPGEGVQSVAALAGLHLDGHTLRVIIACQPRAN